MHKTHPRQVSRQVDAAFVAFYHLFDTQTDAKRNLVFVLARVAPRRRSRNELITSPAPSPRTKSAAPPRDRTGGAAENIEFLSAAANDLGGGGAPAR